MELWSWVVLFLLPTIQNLCLPCVLLATTAFMSMLRCSGRQPVLLVQPTHTCRSSKSSLPVASVGAENSMEGRHRGIKFFVQASFQALIQQPHLPPESSFANTNPVMSHSFQTLLGRCCRCSKSSCSGYLMFHHLCLCGPFCLGKARHHHHHHKKTPNSFSS